MKNWKPCTFTGIFAIIFIAFGFFACDEKELDPSYKIGDTGPGGGIIFYYNEEGFTMTDTGKTCHYLEASPNDIGTYAWASSEFISTWINDIGSWSEGAGRKHTTLILDTDENAPAALICKNYSNNGKTDWFLPCVDELYRFYLNRAIFSIPDSAHYWSSTQGTDTYACSMRFNNGGNTSNAYKHETLSVRAIRAF